MESEPNGSPEESTCIDLRTLWIYPSQLDYTRFNGLQGNEHVHRLSNIFGFRRFNKGIQESKDIIITQIENLKKCVLNWNSLDLWNVEGIELLKELLGIQTINIAIHYTSRSSFSLKPSIDCSSKHT